MELPQSASHLNGKLKVLSFGAGAIGTYIAGSLALAWHQVVFVEQPAVVEELRQRGLRLDLTLDRRRQTKDASVCGPCFFVIVPAWKKRAATDRLTWLCLPEVFDTKSALGRDKTLRG
jgi:hypothetical protein